MNVRRSGTTYLLVGALSGALERVDIGLLQHDVSVATANTLDGGQRDRDGALAVNVGAEHTKNVLELLGDHERLPERNKEIRHLTSQKT